MFKTIYSKYMGVMLGVIAGCFLLMTMVLLLVFRSYSQASRQEQIQNTMFTLEGLKEIDKKRIQNLIGQINKCNLDLFYKNFKRY